MRITMGTTAHVRFVRQIESSIDQRNMRKGLGKVADQRVWRDVVLFREQAQLVASFEQA
jgi:hypothetical protein